MMYVIMALDLLGYAPEHPDRIEAQKQFDHLMLETDDELIFQPCFSPVWDTAIAAFAVGESGMVPADRLRATGDWLLSKEVRRRGDWSVKRPDTEPSGWYFEFANEFYPDIDDTAMALLAWGTRNPRTRRRTRRVSGAPSSGPSTCSRRMAGGRRSMWTITGALSYVPFADHNAMLDPTCPDITGRVLEALCRFGVPPDHARFSRGIAYLLRTQEQDGSWFGPLGCQLHLRHVSRAARP